MQEIAGKAAFITGGASGIGLALARALAAAGARVVVADIDAGRLAAALAELREAGAVAEAITLDVADAGAWQDAREQAERRVGPIQIVCNNAGVGTGPSNVADMSPEHWAWAVGINLNGVFFGARTFAGRLRELALPGHIVNTSSIMGYLPIANQAAYVATKYAVVGLSEVMRIDLASAGIGVSVLCPGLVATPLRANSQALRPGGGQSGFGPLSSDGRLSERPPGPIGDMVVAAIRENRFHVFPHPEYRDLVGQRMERTLKSFRRSALAGYSEDPAFLGKDCLALFSQEL
jgi:NAD(P)-dependent dehydrogenase (short-subunit alcohol dehydrogenase family)